MTKENIKEIIKKVQDVLQYNKSTDFIKTMNPNINMQYDINKDEFILNEIVYSDINTVSIKKKGILFWDNARSEWFSIVEYDSWEELLALKI